MVKPQRRPAPKGPPAKGKRLPEEDELFSDSDDDAFKGKKDKVGLNMSDDDEGDDDSLDVEGVYDLEDGSDDDEDDGEDEGDEDEDDEDDEEAIYAAAIKRGGRDAERECSRDLD